MKKGLIFLVLLMAYLFISSNYCVAGGGQGQSGAKKKQIFKNLSKNEKIKTLEKHGNIIQYIRNGHPEVSLKNQKELQKTASSLMPTVKENWRTKLKNTRKKPGTQSLEDLFAQFENDEEKDSLSVAKICGKVRIVGRDNTYDTTVLDASTDEQKHAFYWLISTIKNET